MFFLLSKLCIDIFCPILYNVSGDIMVKVEGTLEKKSTTNNYNNYKKNELTKTLILGLVGLVLVLMPGTLNKILGVIVGIVLLIIGIAGIFQYSQNKIGTSTTLVSGIFYSILGSIILLYPGSVVRAIAIGIGISLTISGLVKVKWAFTLKGVDNAWIGTLIIGVLTTILGLVLIFSPFSGDAITKITGAFLVVVAVFDLIDNYILQK